MKKMISILLGLCIVLTVLGLVACASSGGEALIGTWTSTFEGGGRTVVFEEGGSGEWSIDINTVSSTIEISWSTDADQLTITDEFDTRVYTYEIDGDTLTLFHPDHDDTLTLTREHETIERNS